MKPGISVREAAELAGCQVRTMLNRLRAIDKRSGGKVLRQYGSGRTSKLWVDQEALMLELRSDHTATSQELGDLASRLDDLDRRLEALRGAHRGLRREVKKDRNRQREWNSACEAVLDGLRRMQAAH